MPSMLTALGETTKVVSPNAYKLASLGHLDKLVSSMYGMERMTHKEATVIVGTRFKMERDRVKEAFENIKDSLAGIPEDAKIKVATHAWAPAGVMPEAWNFMRVQKVALLADIADLATQLGETKIASEALREHDRLAGLAFDYFKSYASKMSDKFAAALDQHVGEATEKIANSILSKTKDLAKNVFQNEKVREYGGTALKGLVGGAGLAAGAAPIASHFAQNTADDILGNARDKALQTAAGTAGIAVGANQLNNLLGRISTAAADSEEVKSRCRKGSGMAPEDTEDDAEAHPLAKMAFHFLIDIVAADEAVRAQNKIACVYAIHEFVERETPMFDPKVANMFNPAAYQNVQGMAGAPVETPQYPMGPGGTPMAGDSASAIGNAAAGGASGGA